MAAATALQCVSFGKSQQSHALCPSSFVHSQAESVSHTTIGDVCSNNIYSRISLNSTRSPRLKVSCTSQKQDDASNIIKNVSNELNVSNPSTPVTTIKEVPSTNFVDIFAFGGPAPELINGRLAMLGFVSALGVEIATGQDLLLQLQNGGFKWFLVTAFLFTTASLAPLFQGVSPQSKSKGFFTTKAETWNGRAAMVGLVALALTEYAKGGALF